MTVKGGYAVNYTGTSGNDTYNGTSEDDVISGLGGNDTLSGGDGNDVIDGGDGEDRLSGGLGNDTLYSISGTDRLVDGGAGDDTIALGSRYGSILSTFKQNVLVGGSGTDTLYVYGTATFSMSRFDAVASGFEVLRNDGYAIYGDTDANRLDFSGLSVSTYYGAIVYGLGGADVLTGTSGFDLLYGGDDGDTLVGGDGGDQLYGEGGDDTLDGGAGADTLQGADGADRIDGGGDNDSLNGGSADDVLIGGDGDDVLDGADGADTLTGGVGNDSLYALDGRELKLDGGAGDDVIVIGSRYSSVFVTLGNGVLVGGTGTDTFYVYGTITLDMTRFVLREAGIEALRNDGYGLYGTAEANRLDFSGVTVSTYYGAIVYGLAGADIVTGTSGFDLLYGGDDGDTLVGGDGGDQLYGEGGDDTLDGGAGADTLQGADGADRIDGGGDNDSLNGGSADDVLIGGDGDDVLDGADGADTLTGGVGNDSLYALDGRELKLDGGAGDDVIVIGSRYSSVFVTLGNGVLIGGTGTDTFYVYGTITLDMTRFVLREAGIEALRNDGYGLYGTAEANRLDFSGVAVSTYYGTIVYGLAGADIVTGTDAVDVLYGGDDGDTLVGGAGNDQLYGEGGDDTLQGGDGIDTIQGADGADRIDGGNEGDSLNGGSGDDTIVGGGGDDTIDGADGADDVSGGDGNDVISALDGAETRLDGGSGDDVIYVGSRYTGVTVTIGEGVLVGGSGTDTLVLYGRSTFTGRFVAQAAGFERLSNDGNGYIYGTDAREHLDFSGMLVATYYGVFGYGGGDADTLIGTTAIDYLYGDAGDDTIEGGSGNDFLYGGDGTGDIASFAGSAAKVSVSLALQNAAQDTLGAGLDTLTGFEGLAGSRFADVLIGDAGANFLFGNAGADRLEGGEGADVLRGDAGNDALIGGTWRDTAAYSGAWVEYDVRIDGSGHAVADRRTAGDGTDTLQSIEQLRFANGTFDIADTINVGPAGVADGARLAEAGVGGPGIPVATGNLLANDTDANLLVAGLGEWLRVTAVSGVAIAGSTEIAGRYGTLTIAADGSYSYALDNRNAAVAALREGETLSESFGYALADAHGLASDATLTITVDGAADTRARADLIQTTVGKASALDAAVLLANDAYAPGATITQVTNASGVTVSLVDGRLVIVAGKTPGSFDYVLTAANGESSIGHVDVAGATYKTKAVLTADPAAAAVDFVGGRKADVLTGGGGDDRLIGDAGADVMDGAAGADRMEGGAGDDRYTVDNAGDRVIEATGGGRDTVRVTLASYTLADAVETLVFAGAGAFEGIGNASANAITGGAGDDRLVGLDGQDVLAGGAGDDRLDGGAGLDTASYAEAAGGVQVDLRISGAQQTVGGGIDTLISIENLTGGRGADTLNGSDGGNVLSGGAQRDVLNGNGGNDRLFGDGGADLLTGGAGKDAFAYRTLADCGEIDRPDRIRDFSSAQGDTIDLSEIDPDAATAGDQTFTFVGTAAFSADAAAFEVRVQDNGDGTWTLQGDVNHDGVADFALLITTAAPLEVGDLVL